MSTPKELGPMERWAGRRAPISVFGAAFSVDDVTANSPELFKQAMDTAADERRRFYIDAVGGAVRASGRRVGHSLLHLGEHLAGAPFPVDRPGQSTEEGNLLGANRVGWTIDLAKGIGERALLPVVLAVHIAGAYALDDERAQIGTAVHETVGEVREFVHDPAAFFENIMSD